jgi:hypothetical protein
MKAEEFIESWDKKNGIIWSESVEGIAEVMEEYSSLQIKEAIEEAEAKIIKAQNPFCNIHQQEASYNNGIKICIEILNSKINEK